MHKIASSLTALALTGALILPAFAAAQFSDVPADHWALRDINTAAEHAWVNGIGNGLYAPERRVTVAEWLVMVTRAVDPEGVAKPAGGGQWYSDKWYGRNIEVAIERN